MSWTPWKAGPEKSAPLHPGATGATMPPLDPDILLAARGLRLFFGSIPGADGVDLDVRQGEVLGVIGPNGAGKTTLFNLLCGTLGADSGRVWLEGRDISSLGTDARARLGLVRTFQHGRLFAGLSARENLLLGAHGRRGGSGPGLKVWMDLVHALWPRGKNRQTEKFLEDRVESLAGEFGDRLLPRLDRGAWTFSYANRRRIELARALAAEPRVLLLDEPTAGMNPAETLELLEYLRGLKARGQTMVIIEHKLPMLMELADQVLVMDEGRVIARETPGRVALNPQVIEAYLGHSHVPDSGGTVSMSPADPKAAPGPEKPLPLLELRDIRAAYGAFKVLHHLDLHILPGEILCLLGGNASGKSTTMKTILGLLQPQAGDILWEGRSIRDLDTPRRIALGMASVPESRRIFPAMTVEENLLMGTWIRQGRELDEIYALFPRLAQRRRQSGGTLSGGEQQMLAMARALMGGPRLLCMDEPTMGLSPLWVDRVLELIQSLNKQGITMFMVEQNAHLALGMAHRACVLQNGHLVMEGPAREIAGDPRIRDAYLGGEQMEGI